jgi:hypothetical protein
VVQAQQCGGNATSRTLCTSAISRAISPHLWTTYNSHLTSHTAKLLHEQQQCHRILVNECVESPPVRMDQTIPLPLLPVDRRKTAKPGSFPKRAQSSRAVRGVGLVRTIGRRHTRQGSFRNRNGTAIAAAHPHVPKNGMDRVDTGSDHRCITSRCMSECLRPLNRNSESHLTANMGRASSATSMVSNSVKRACIITNPSERPRGYKLSI